MGDNYIKGRGSQLNPSNPFLRQDYVTDHIEGLDGELFSAPRTQLFFESPKGIVNKIESPDLGLSYSINPYQGCEHGCIYCYARNSHQYWGFNAGLDFESKIVVKKNAPQLLEQFILKKSWNGAPLMLSGNTDCYQPIEREYKITRQILTVLCKYKQAVGLITKNSLIIRDIDIFSDMARDNLVHVFFSINTLNENLRSKMEPRTASAVKKLNVMDRLASSGIPVGIMNAPVIPGLNHHEIPDIIKAASEHGATDAGYTVVRLNGSIGKLFQDWVTKNYYDRKDKILNQVADLHGGQISDTKWGRRMIGEGNISNIIAQLFSVAKSKYMSGNSMTPLDTTKFRKGGNYVLY